MRFAPDLAHGQQRDREDPLCSLREHFHVPIAPDGRDAVYLCGHSLGLQPKATAPAIAVELEKWQRLGVLGHFAGEYPWLSYHEGVTSALAEIVGARPSEVVAMNSLTVNLHLLMVSFYRPNTERYKILLEAHAFPSDYFAAESQVKFHGFDPHSALVLLKGESQTTTDHWLQLIEQHKNTLAFVLLPGVQYLSGTVFDIARIVGAAHKHGIVVGVDLAHAVGNIPLHLHDWDVDFAAWCHYKYVNAGPGAVAGAFVHERHLNNTSLPRFTGWWGQNKDLRFRMENTFDPIPTAEGWQCSNPPIFSLVGVRTSLDLFRQGGGMERLRDKSLRLSSYLEFLLRHHMGERIRFLTPIDMRWRGSQLSLQIKSEIPTAEVVVALEREGIFVDLRHPDIIRAAPVALYNSFTDVHRFAEALARIACGRLNVSG